MFKNRVEAGALLAEQLKQYKEDKNILVAGIPRGGIVVAYALAQSLKLPLNAIIVKKIGSPKNPEFAIGAVSEFGDVFWDEQAINYLNLGKQQKEKALETKKREIKEQVASFSLPERKFMRKAIILVDDGVATGATCIAAAISLQNQNVEKLILATPVIAPEIKEKLKKYFDEIIALETPDTLNAVGEFYKEFDQVSDEEVSTILKK